MAALSEEELKSLIRSPKPAFTAIGVTNDPNSEPTFKAIHNGQGVWMIERPTTTELLAGERTILVNADAVQVIDMPVAVNNDVKAALDGRRLAYLDQGSLEITGAMVVADRPCFQVRALGLKNDEDRPFELAVDMDTFAILRTWRGSDLLFEVTEFLVGAAEAD